jgi:multicomponent Na+:H+ antiporter subunit E
MRRLLTSAGLRAALLVWIWWALNEGVGGSPLLLCASVGAATASSLRWVPPARTLRLSVLPPLALFLVREGLAASVDVARRALLPGCRVDPGFIEFPLRLPEGGARHFFVGVVNLLPGTASARIHPDHLTLHVLVRGAEVEPVLRDLETLLLDLVR